MNVDLHSLAQTLGYPAAALGILIETLGIPFPGETLMLVVSAYAATGRLDIRLVILTATAGTIAGANIGYAIGRRGGRPFVERYAHRFRIRPSHVARAEAWFHRYGASTILFARFVTGLRQWSSVLAGMAHMPFGRFELYTVIGSTVWATLICLAGFFLGKNLALLEQILRDIGFAGVALVVTVVIAVILYRRSRRRPE